MLQKEQSVKNMQNQSVKMQCTDLILMRMQKLKQLSTSQEESSFNNYIIHKKEGVIEKYSLFFIYFLSCIAKTDFSKLLERADTLVLILTSSFSIIVYTPFKASWVT